MKVVEVAKLTPLERFLYWVRERHTIWLRRQAGQLRPWTDDEVLQRYHFCNIHRISDRVSQWLLNYWYLPNRDHPNMLVACTLARQLNSPMVLKEVRFPRVWDPDIIERVLHERTKKGLSNYASAYRITSLGGTNKPTETVRVVCEAAHKASVLVDTSSMQVTWTRLLNLPGFGSFIAGQVVADLRWGLTGSWADKGSWAPLGPGSLRGLNRVMNRPVDMPIRQGRFLEEMLDLWTGPGKYLPAMEAIDFQNCLCEFDKYERALSGCGYRRKYRGC